MSAQPPLSQGMALQVQVEQSLPMPLSGAFGCAAGELLALVGPSGAGKTSLLRLMAGLLRPRQGRVSVDGEVWVDTATGQWRAPQQRHVGLVFQHYALMPHLDACDNVALSLLHLPKAQRQAQARRWLDHVGLDAAQQQRRPAALSGGQQQRVAMARALARQPRLLLLDEPFAAVDQMTRQGLYRLLADLRRELAIPIVLVTHDLHEARLLADRLVVLDGGRVVQQGTPAAIHRAPRNARVADLVGLQNRFEGVWLGPAEQGGVGRLRWTDPRADVVLRGGGPVDPGKAPLQEPLLLVPDKGRLEPGQAVSWVIPGEAIELIAPGLRCSGDFDGVVSQVRHLGEITLATVELTQPPYTRLTLTLAGAGAALLSALPSSVSTDIPPLPVAVRLDTRQVHVMPVRSA
jgi:molybdate transport system ATP-binding protein